MACPFCDIEIEERTITKNDYARTFPSNRAIGPCHLLITPLRHAATWDELASEEQIAILDLLQQIKPILQKEFKAEGFNVAWNEGEVAGQSIPHFHLHVVPRKTGDRGVIGHDPRQFLYRPETWEEVSEEVLEKIKQTLSQAAAKF